MWLRIEVADLFSLRNDAGGDGVVVV